jgi:ABC-type Na+ transport system ATPase subunit NatA
MTRAVELNGLTKVFGEFVAVEDVNAVALPGRVTALLGPNGAGKTTTLRMLLGLVAPSSGTATFDGQRYDELSDPVREVGALLEASGCHPGRTALAHLRILATAARLPRQAPERVLDETGLTEDARRRVGESRPCSSSTSRPTAPARGAMAARIRTSARRGGAHGAAVQPRTERSGADRRPHQALRTAY